ncbi:MAG: hypothetical protein HKP48_00220 [Winogradskyella sp.]|uniref:hypothetical protein n=1 Tax=Winogradskyella sp. TaxID=1883156 RepID=UPI0017BAB50A|nr:hypothetical protein [Winogradskyella sp.]MBT8245890.1 hypothetical protein [Winogradskyella sp.]NNK21740.1 hypothetical protein [Winogradskyella sp.]
MKKAILFLNLLIFTISIAQEREYVITKKKDTIYGKVTRATSLLNAPKVKFKIKDLNGHKIILKPADVETIKSLKGVDGKSIIRTVYDDWYVKQIIDGRIKVYQLLDGVIFYMSKDSSKIRLNDFGGFNSRKESHARIRPLFSDNPTILKEFDSLVGTEKNIKYMIKKYNSFYNKY